MFSTGSPRSDLTIASRTVAVSSGNRLDAGARNEALLRPDRCRARELDSAGSAERSGKRHFRIPGELYSSHGSNRGAERKWLAEQSHAFDRRPALPRSASWRVSLPLRIATTSPPSGCRRDLHPQAVEHARYTIKAGSVSAPRVEKKDYIRSDQNFKRSAN